MGLFPTNMPRFVLVSVKKICWDLFKKQNILQGLFFYKMGSIIICHLCKSSQK